MRVQTNRGPVEIRDIQPGDEVYTWNDGKPSVNRVTYRSEPRKQPVYRLRTVHREITASGNHPFLTLRKTGRCTPPEPRFPEREKLERPHNRRQRVPVDGNKVRDLYLAGASLSEVAGVLGTSISTVVSRLEETGTPRRPVGGATPGKPMHTVGDAWELSWVNLEDLRRGDLIVSLRSLPDDVAPPEDPLLADRRFLWLLGLAFGDGSLSPVRANLVSLCVFGDLRDEVQGRLEDFCGKRGGSNESAGVRVHSEILASGLRRYGMDAPSTSRVLPRELWNLPHASIQAFLDGYTAADGSRSKRPGDPALQYGSANRGLIEDVRNLHMILGHNVTRVREQRRTHPVVIKGKQVKNARTMWTFQAYETGIKLATGGIGDLRRNPDVARMFPVDSHFIPQRVTSIEPAGTEDTYDITVDDTHNFVAEGLVVHNSGFTQGVYDHFGYNAPRTSEAQGAWVTKTKTPQAGGLAFFNSPAGGPPPGHVGIVIGANSMISQAGPQGALGPTLSSLAGNMFTGIPPGGFKTGGGGGSTALAGGGSASANQALGQRMAAAIGWTGAEWAALNAVEMREAGWSTTARNASSGAYGIAQFISGPSEYAQYGGSSATAGGQIAGFLNYIKERYGDPIAAEAHEAQYGWYDQGGWLQPGMTMVMNATGHPEPVLNPEQWDRLNSAVGSGDGIGDKLDRIAGLLMAGPRATAGGMSEVLNGTAHTASFRQRYPRNN